MRNSILPIIGMLCGVAVILVMSSNYVVYAEAETVQTKETTVQIADAPIIEITSETDPEPVKVISPKNERAKRPESEKLNEVMNKEVQEYIFSLALARFPDDKDSLEKYYASLIGLAQGESEFKTKAKNSNGNGTTDRGLFQTNSCWIKELKKLGYISSSEDLYDPIISAKCGDYVWWQCWSQYGWDERSYGVYLYGKPHRNNKWTARVWNMQKAWYEELYGKES